MSFVEMLDRIDWSGLPLALLKRAHDCELVLPTYDFVFVDEAQFFAPVWLKLVQMIVRPKSGQLVLAADPAQGFLKRRESWAACGMNVRGRTIRLQRAYRNSRDILDYAARFYRDRVDAEDEEVNLPNEQEIGQLPPGPPPEIVTARAPQDEVIQTCKEIRKAIASGAKASDILIIVPDPQWRDRVISALNRGGRIAINAQQDFSTESARVCSINAATGLEAPIVFLLGLSDLIGTEQALKLMDEDRKELVRDNTRRLYMAMTRATQRLVIFSRCSCSQESSLTQEQQ